MHIPVMADESRTEQNIVKSDSKNENQTFEAIGKQVEQLALDEIPHLDELPLPHGYEGKVVPTEVIDSLCMNCGKDVCSRSKFINLNHSL